MIESEPQKAAAFLNAAIREICGLNSPDKNMVMDIGCGCGHLVRCLAHLGYDAYGCDINPYWKNESSRDTWRLDTISLTPYRLPFKDNTFDVVLSTSVLEHAQNKEEVFREIHRILKPGGYSMHLFPSKWYLPLEPHIYVPLINYFWPSCPKWWLGLWALFGIRNEFQHNKSWKEVTLENYQYCMNGLSYWPNRKYRRLSVEVFGNYSEPMTFYINNAHGGFAKTFRKMPLRRFWGWLSSEFRMNFIIQRKQPEK